MDPLNTPINPYVTRAKLYLQQVMSRLPTTLTVFDDNTKLSSKRIYGAWQQQLLQKLGFLEYGLVDFLFTTQIPRPENLDLTAADLESLNVVYQQFATLVTDLSIHPELIKVYSSLFLTGVNMFSAITTALSVPPTRQSHQFVEKFLDLKSMSPSEAFAFLLEFKFIFTPQFTLDNFLALSCLSVFNNAQIQNRILDSADGTPLTLTQLHAPLQELLFSPSRTSVNQQPTTLAVTTGRAGTRSGKIYPPCTHCKRTNHSPDRCWKHMKEEAKKKKEQSSPPVQSWCCTHSSDPCESYLTTEEKQDTTNYWVDTGSTVHISNNKLWHS
ncbi:unnamed protein product [Ambrosiozyma monospora]|uniref:Unnamed protein product n=1 Tax=Ambrosiozyma monospora TaxID=43982 RepID=A0A9W6Z4H6_AMBMO|nr:unnamed protein product [Ambrosiozyma monospora]